MIDIEKIKPEIERICRRLPVKRLGLFGSVLSQNFSLSSDIDVLVIFDTSEDIDLFNKYFELKEQLEEVFERDIDLVVDKKFKNPIFRESVDRTRTVIYERWSKKTPHWYPSGSQRLCLRNRQAGRPLFGWTSICSLSQCVVFLRHRIGQICDIVSVHHCIASLHRDVTCLHWTVLPACWSSEWNGRILDLPKDKIQNDIRKILDLLS